MRVNIRVRMRRRLLRGVYPVPTLLTIGNLLCGFFAIAWVFQEDYAFAAGAILLAAVLDLLDGAVARMTGSASELGVQLDSLADLVSFGVAPAVLAHVWAFKPVNSRMGFFVEVLPAALFVAAGAFRLARFNIQTAFLDKRYFVGLPIPAAAATIASFILFMRSNEKFTAFGREIASREFTTGAVALMTVILAFLMVSRIRYRSLKGIELKRAWPASALMGIVLVLMFLTVALATVPRWVLFYTFLGYVLSGPLRHVLAAARRPAHYREAALRDAVNRPAEPPGRPGPGA